MNQNPNKKNSFTTVELIISISIIVILSGIFLVNYNLQKDKVDLNNTLSIVSQEIRKAQGLAMAQSVLPPQCVTEGGLNKRDVFGIVFSKTNNYVSLYVDKNGNGFPDVFSETTDSCNCSLDNECIERRYFSPAIQINAITPMMWGTGYITFSRQDLSVKINYYQNSSTLQVDFCPKSACSQNTRNILMNNKGMVRIQ